MSVPRASKAKALFESLAHGLGAVKLSPSVSALRLKCHKRPGMKGERQFIDSVLPRLAFANPSTPIHISHFPQYIPKAEREAAASSDASSSAATTGQASKVKVKAKISTITIEFKGLPPRQITIGQKPANEIAKELLDLARFTEQALAGVRRSAAASSASATPAATATATESTTESSEQSGEAQTIEEVAPEPTSTNLAGSAEGLSDVEGQKAAP